MSRAVTRFPQSAVAPLTRRRLRHADNQGDISAGRPSLSNNAAR
jgi:hypothetical protein